MRSVWASWLDRNDPETQALLEAALLHIRLLDEFLGIQLARRASLGPGEVDGSWNVTECALACCEERATFFTLLAKSKKDRYDAFLDAPKLVDEDSTRFKTALT